MKNQIILFAATVSLIAGSMFSTGISAIAKDANLPTKTMTASEIVAEKRPQPGFSDDQLERVHAIKIKYDDINDARDLELEKLNRQIIEGLNQQNADKATLFSVQTKINELEAKAANDDLQMMIDLHDVLTPEQRTNLRRETLQQEAMSGGMAPAPAPMMCPPPPMPH